MCGATQTPEKNFQQLPVVLQCLSMLLSLSIKQKIKIFNGQHWKAFFEMYRGNGTIEDYLAMFDLAATDTHNLCGLQLNDVGQSYFYYAALNYLTGSCSTFDFGSMATLDAIMKSEGS